MQKIIKPRSPSRQLLETVNFAFMKFFDSLVKIAVFRASRFFDFLHFKGQPFINHKISFNLRVQVAIFLTFHNCFMMLVHMEVHSKYHLLMMD